MDNVRQFAIGSLLDTFTAAPDKINGLMGKFLVEEGEQMRYPVDLYV